MNKDTKRLLLQIGLFILTLISTTLSGAEWRYGGLFLYAPETLGWEEFLGGFAFSIPFVLLLLCHLLLSSLHKQTTLVLPVSPSFRMNVYFTHSKPPNDFCGAV